STTMVWPMAVSSSLANSRPSVSGLLPGEAEMTSLTGLAWGHASAAAAVPVSVRVAAAHAARCRKAESLIVVSGQVLLSLCRFACGPFDPHESGCRRTAGNHQGVQRHGAAAGRQGHE